MGASKSRRAILLETVKQMFGKQKVAGPSLTMGCKEVTEHVSPAGFLLIYHAGVPTKLWLSTVRTVFQEQALSLRALRQVGERPKFLSQFLFLKNGQFKIISIPKGLFWGSKLCLPSISKDKH